MRVLFYLTGPAPSEKERDLIKRLEDEGHEVEQENGKYFEGPHKDPPDAVYAAQDNIRSAYEGVDLIGDEAPEEELAPEITHQVKGGGWVWIYVDGEKVDSVRKNDLEEALERIRGDVL